MSVVKCIPNFWQRRTAEVVDLQHCSLVYVPDQVIACGKTLQELYLDANQLSELPKGFFKLASLRKLGLGDNELTCLSPDIGLLENLTEIDLSRNSIDEIPDEIRRCRNLHVIDLTGNPLKGLPNGFTLLTNLTNLTLNDVTLCDLPNDIGNLVSLTHLEARDNYFSVVPVTIGRLSNLRLLDLGGNELSFLPDTIGNLGALEECSLDANQLSQLPITIGRLKNLVAIDVTDNRLYRLPDAIGGCSSLMDLVVTQNMLETLPDTIGQLKNLRLLKADQNRLIALTGAIGDCTTLRDLILSHNLLFQLPPMLGRLRNLQLINVDNNQLEFLPPELGHCENLHILSVQNNLLETLPQTLGNVQQLRILYLAGNKLECLPGSLRRCQLQAVWLTEAQSKPLMAFCEDEDPRTGQSVLRCCLLPQQQIACGSLENLTRSSLSTDDSSLRRQRDSLKQNFDGGPPLVTSTPSTRNFGGYSFAPSFTTGQQLQPPLSNNFNTTVTVTSNESRPHQSFIEARSSSGALPNEVLNSTYTVTRQDPVYVQTRPRSQTDPIAPIPSQQPQQQQQQDGSFAGSEPSVQSNSNQQTRVDSPVVIQSPTSLSLNESAQPVLVQIEKKYKHQEFDDKGACTVDESQTSKVTIQKQREEYYFVDQQPAAQQMVAAQPPAPPAPPFPTRASVVRVQVTRGRPTTTSNVEHQVPPLPPKGPSIEPVLPHMSSVATSSPSSVINCPELPPEALDDELTNLAATYDQQIAPKAKIEGLSDTDFSETDKPKPSFVKAPSPPRPPVAPKPKLPTNISPASISPPKQQQQQQQQPERVQSPSQRCDEIDPAHPHELPSERLKRLREARDQFFKKAFENEPIFAPVVHKFEPPPDFAPPAAPTSKNTNSTTTNPTATTTSAKQPVTAVAVSSASSGDNAQQETESKTVYFKPPPPEKTRKGESRVCFMPAEGDDGDGESGGAEDDEESSSSSQLKRQKTPLPRDLKTKSGFLSRFHGQKRGSIDGSVIPHNPELANRESFSFRPQRTSPAPGSSEEQQQQQQSSRETSKSPTREASPPVSSSQVEVEVSSTRVITTKSTTIVTSSSSLQPEETTANTGETEQRNRSRVAFSDDSNNNEDGGAATTTTTEWRRLQRRDTPHHLLQANLKGQPALIGETEEEKQQKVLQLLSGGSIESTSTSSKPRPNSFEIPIEFVDSAGNRVPPPKPETTEQPQQPEPQVKGGLASDQSVTNSMTSTTTSSHQPGFVPSGFRGFGIALANETEQQQIEDAEYIEKLRQKQQSMLQQQPTKPPVKPTTTTSPQKPVEHDSSDGEVSSSETSTSGDSVASSVNSDRLHDKVYDARTGLVTVVPNTSNVTQRLSEDQFPPPPPQMMGATTQQSNLAQLGRQPMKIQMVRGVNVRAPGSTSQQPVSDSPPKYNGGPSAISAPGSTFSPGSQSQQSFQSEPLGQQQQQPQPQPPTGGNVNSESSLSSNAVEYGVVRKEYRLSKSAGSGSAPPPSPSRQSVQRLSSPTSTLTPSLTTPPITPRPPSQTTNRTETEAVTEQVVIDRDQAALADRLREVSASPKLVRTSSLRDLLMGEKPTTNIPNISSFQTDAQPVYASITNNSVEIVFNKPTTLVCSTANTEVTRLKRLSHASSEGSPKPQSRFPHPSGGGSRGNIPGAVAAEQQGSISGLPPKHFVSPGGTQYVPQDGQGQPGQPGHPFIHVDGQAYETFQAPDGRLYVVPQGSNLPSQTGSVGPTGQPLFVETGGMQPGATPGPMSDGSFAPEQVTSDGMPISMTPGQVPVGFDSNYLQGGMPPQQQQFFHMGPGGPCPPGMMPPPGAMPMGPPPMMGPFPPSMGGPMGPPLSAGPQGPLLHPPINPQQKKVLLELDRVELRLSVRKDPSLGFGMRIAGGRGSTPFKGEDDGIFISSITKDGPASRAGLMVGDKLLSVSGYNLVGADHQQAVTTLKKAGKLLELVVEREVFANGPDSSVTTKHFPEIPGVPTVTGEEYEVQGETLSSLLKRDVSFGGIGISIGGGRGTSAPVTSKFTADALYISKIHPGGPADREGVLKIGDRLLTVNGNDVTDSRYETVVALLDSPDVRLVVYREHLVPKLKPNEPGGGGNSSGTNTMRSEIVAGPQNALVPVQRPPPMMPGQQNWPVPVPSSANNFPASLPPVNLFPTPGVFLVPMQPATGAVFIPSHAAVPPGALPVNGPNMMMGAPAGPGGPSPVVNGPMGPMGPGGVPAGNGPGSMPPMTSGGMGNGVVMGGPRPMGGMGCGPFVGPPNGMPGGPYPAPPGMYPPGACPVDPSFMFPNGPGSMGGSYHQSGYQPYPTTNGGPGYRPSTPPAGGDRGNRQPGSVPPSPGPLVQKSRSEASLLSKSNPEPYSLEEIRVIKAGGPLGISIVGGTDHACQPFGSKEAPGVFVSKISPDGPASRTNLRIGDRLLEVNGIDVRTATHNEAVAALITPVHEVRILVRHDPQPTGLQEVVLFRGPGEKLGLSIRGGVNSPSGNPYDKMDDGIFVSKITAGCVAHDGRIQVGHRLIEVNGVSLLGAAHQEAVTLLRNVDGQFTMMVCDGWNQRIAQNVLLGRAKSMAGGSQADSLCTVDRMDVEFFTKQGYTVEWTQGGTAVVKPRQEHTQPPTQQTPPQQAADELSQNGSQENGDPSAYIYQNLPPIPQNNTSPPQQQPPQQNGKKMKKSNRA